MPTQYIENRLLDRTNSTYTPISYEDIKVKGQKKVIVRPISFEPYM